MTNRSQYDVNPGALTLHKLTNCLQKINFNKKTTDSTDIGFSYLEYNATMITLKLFTRLLLATSGAKPNELFARPKFVDC